MGLPMQCSVHAPTRFLLHHTHQLLPDWPCAIASVLIVLQRAEQPLLSVTPASRAEKNRLRSQFFDFARPLCDRLQAQGYATDFFDPKTGHPMRSASGTLWLDDVAVVCACLPYPKVKIQDCQTLHHPTWGQAVYPSILLSAAPPAVLARAARTVGLDVTVTGPPVLESGSWGGTGESSPLALMRSEYHHSFMGLDSLTQ